MTEKSGSWSINTLLDLARRKAPMADSEKKRTKRFVPKDKFHPGGEKGKLHRELGIPEGEKIPKKRLEAATHSKNREVRDDAIRAETMEGWRHGAHARRAARRYSNPKRP